jgi:cellulose synthase (UDP-forming)
MQGAATGLLLLLPPLHIFFNLTPVNLSIGFGSWLFFYLAFYAMQIVVAFYIMGGFRFETLVLAAVSFPIYVRAMVNVIMNRQEKWHVTGRKDTIDSPFNYIVPQMLIFLFLLFTSAIGLVKAVYVESFSIAIFWNLCNTIIFGAFLVLAWKEHRVLVKDKKRQAIQPAITPEGSPA